MREFSSEPVADIIEKFLEGHDLTIEEIAILVGHIEALTDKMNVLKHVLNN